MLHFLFEFGGETIMKLRIEFLKKEEKEKLMTLLETQYDILSESVELESERKRCLYKKVFIEIQEKEND